MQNGIIAIADILRNMLLYDGQIDVPLQFISCVWEILIDFLTKSNWTNDLNIPSNSELKNKTYLELLVDECAIAVKLSIHLFGLSRESLSSLPKTVYEKRIKNVEIFSIRSWMIFYLIIKKILTYDDSAQRGASNSILEYLHVFLGEMNVCSADQGTIF